MCQTLAHDEAVYVAHGQVGRAECEVAPPRHDILVGLIYTSYGGHQLSVAMLEQHLPLGDERHRLDTLSRGDGVTERLVEPYAAITRDAYLDVGLRRTVHLMQHPLQAVEDRE